MCVVMVAGGHLTESPWSSQHDRMQNDACGQPSPLNVYPSARQRRRSKLFQPLSSSAVKKRATPRRPREPAALRSVPVCRPASTSMATHVALRSRKTVRARCAFGAARVAAAILQHRQHIPAISLQLGHVKSFRLPLIKAERR